MNNPVKIFAFSYKDRQFQCQLYLTQSRRNKNKISISITTDQIIKIKAPPQTSHNQILASLTYFKEWIYSHPVYQQPTYHYVEHEKHLYLGQYYSLKITETIKHPQAIQVMGENLNITVRNNVPLRIYNLLESWYKLQALQIFTERIHVLKPGINWIDWQNKPPIIRIKKMKSQWGSYNHKHNGIITLNQHLVKADSSAIDYVIAHECCHAVELNHGKKFYQLLGHTMPEWKKWRNYLRQNNHIIGKDQKPR